MNAPGFLEKVDGGEAGQAWECRVNYDLCTVLECRMGSTCDSVCVCWGYTMKVCV